jgi:hypothetical protein
MPAVVAAITRKETTARSLLLQICCHDNMLYACCSLISNSLMPCTPTKVPAERLLPSRTAAAAAAAATHLQPALSHYC